jgi:hypothetical protein
MSHHLNVAWTASYDLFPLETMAQKKRFYAEAVPNRWAVIFTHDHSLPLAYVEPGEEEGKYVARPLERDRATLLQVPGPPIPAEKVA